MKAASDDMDKVQLARLTSGQRTIRTKLDIKLPRVHDSKWHLEKSVSQSRSGSLLLDDLVCNNGKFSCVSKMFAAGGAFPRVPMYRSMFSRNVAHARPV